MPSSTEQPQRAPDTIVEIARRLCGEPVIAAHVCGGGGNNRVYRILTAGGRFAMKSYGSAELDDRDRLAHEFDGLRFLKAHGPAGIALPSAIAVDRKTRCALYEWIDGVVASDHSTADIASVLELWQALHRARVAPEAADLPPATESVMQLSDLVNQIDVRLHRLAEAESTDSELAAFLRAELRPELSRRAARLSEWDVNAKLPVALRTLSPSDFGFHNALRRPDGTLAFIDFEYFGWDDPVKLTADFLLHPGMQLIADERRNIVDGAIALYAEDANFQRRLAVCYPLYGIRWTLIILNEFLPQLWARRSFSGKGGDWEAAKRVQLRKARSKLAALRSYKEGNLIS